MSAVASYDVRGFARIAFAFAPSWHLDDVLTRVSQRTACFCEGDVSLCLPVTLGTEGLCVRVTSVFARL